MILGLVPSLSLSPNCRSPAQSLKQPPSSAVHSAQVVVMAPKKSTPSKKVCEVAGVAE